MLEVFVLGLIIEGNGGNQLINAKWCKLYSAFSPEDKDVDKDSIRCVVDNDNLTLEEINRRDQGLEQ